MSHIVAIVCIVLLSLLLTAFATIFAAGYFATPEPGEEAARRAGLAALSVLMFSTAVALAVSIYGVRS